MPAQQDRPAVTEAFDAIAEARRQWVDHDLDEPLSMTAATSIVRAQQIVSTAVDRALKPHDLTFARYEVLMLLSFSRSGSLPITKVGERLMVHPTGITKLVDKLEQQGFARREPNPNDRRGTLACITEEGRARAAAATKSVAEVRFGVDLDDGELESIVTLMREIRRQAGDLP